MSLKPRSGISHLLTPINTITPEFLISLDQVLDCHLFLSKYDVHLQICIASYNVLLLKLCFTFKHLNILRLCGHNSFLPILPTHCEYCTVYTKGCSSCSISLLLLTALSLPRNFYKLPFSFHLLNADNRILNRFLAGPLDDDRSHIRTTTTQKCLYLLALCCGRRQRQALFFIVIHLHCLAWGQSKKYP